MQGHIGTTSCLKKEGIQALRSESTTMTKKVGGGGGKR